MRFYRRHVRPVTIPATAYFATPKRFASAVRPKPRCPKCALLSFRISSTISQDNFAFGCCSPLGANECPIGRPPRERPLLCRSALLSCWVPRNRWFGFTQGGLSQRCKTLSPGGIAPFASTQATRCARLRKPFGDCHLSRPYPNASQRPNHRQQSVSAPRCVCCASRISMGMRASRPLTAHLVRRAAVAAATSADGPT